MQVLRLLPHECKMWRTCPCLPLSALLSELMYEASQIPASQFKSSGPSTMEPTPNLT